VGGGEGLGPGVGAPLTGGAGEGLGVGVGALLTGTRTGIVGPRSSCVCPKQSSHG